MLISIFDFVEDFVNFSIESVFFEKYVEIIVYNSNGTWPNLWFR